MRKINKKGAEMTVGTLVIIVLAIILLVVLVIGFTTGWGNLWDKIKNWFGGGPNVDVIKQGCQLACSTNSKFDWCCRTREIRYGDGTKKEVTCASMGENVNCGAISGCTSECSAEVICTGDYEVVATKCPDNREEAKDKRLSAGTLNPLGLDNKCCKVIKKCTETVVSGAGTATVVNGNLCSGTTLVCPVGQELAGTFSDVTAAPVKCCKVDCVAVQVA